MAIGASSPAVTRKSAAGTGVVSVSAAITLGVDVPSAAAVCDCAIGGCIIDDGASNEVGPSSGSVDVDVCVRYNAVRSYNAGNCSKCLPHTVVASQFHTPRSGNKSSTGPVSPQCWFM